MKRPLFALAHLVSLILTQQSTAEQSPSKNADSGSFESDTYNTVNIPPVWTLESAIERALSHNPDILKARANALRARGSLLVSRSAMLPKLRLVGDADRRDVALIDLPQNQLDNPIIDPETRQARDGYSLKAEIRQPLFSGLQNQREYKAERLIAEAAEANVYDTEQRIIAILIQSFDAIIRSEETRASRENSIASFERLLSVAEKRFEAGDVAELETLRIKTELSRAKADLSTEETRVVTDYERIRRTLDLPSSTGSIEIQRELKPKTYEFSLSQAIDNALEKRGDLQNLKLQWEASELRVKGVRGSKLPKLEGVASYDARSSFYDSNNRLDGWQIGIFGSLNIFEGGQQKGLLTIRRAEAEAARMDYEAMKRRIESRLVELSSQLQQEKQTLVSRQDAVELAEKVFEQTEKQYEAGQVGLETVLQVEETLHQAQIELALSIYSHNSVVAQIQYESALGF